MTESRHQSDHRQPRAGKTRRRRIAGVVVTVAVVSSLAIGLAYRHFTDPERIRRIAQHFLQEYTHGHVEIGSADISWFDGIRLFNVTVTNGQTDFARSSSRAATPVISCPQVTLIADRTSLLLGKPKIEAVIAIRPTLTIVRDRGTDQTNLSGLLRSPQRSGGLHGGGPTIELRDATIRVVSREENGERVIEDLKLTIRGRPSPTEADTYDIVWRDTSAVSTDGHSKIDLRTGRLRNVRGGLPWMSIEGVMVALNAGYDGAGAWCDLLGLDGRVRAKDYNLCQGETNAGPRSATIALDNASISVPVSQVEKSLPADQRYLRFERVTGEVVVTTEGIQAEFTGLLHGSECHVSASLRGGLEKLATLDDVDFDVQVRAIGLQLPRADAGGPPDEIRFINRWPRLRRFYYDYDPHGFVDLEISVTKRAGVDEPIVAKHIKLSAQGADMSYRRIPYRLSNVYGLVEYTPQGVFIRNLRGERGGGMVSITGFLEKLTKSAPKGLTITGEGIAIDEALYAALPESYRKACRLFSPQGSVDIGLKLAQSAGTEENPGQWRSNVTVMLRDVSAVYAGFPYPVDHITGTLVAKHKKLEINGVAGRAGRASIGIDGSIAFSDEGIADLALSISGVDVEFNSAFFSALSDDVRRRIDPLHPRGTFDCVSTLSFDTRQQRVVQQTSLNLHDVTIRPDILPVDFTGIHGSIDISADHVRLHDLRGRYKNAPISLEGFADGLTSSQTFEVSVRSRDLELDDSLRAVLPAPIRTALADWSIKGPVNTETIVSRKSPTDADSVRTKIEFQGATVKHAALPATLEDVTGVLVLDDRGVRTDGIDATYGPVSVHATLTAGRSPDGALIEEGTIALAATGATLDNSFRALLPQDLRSYWDRFRPTGSVDLHIDSLRFKRNGNNRPREWAVDGYLEFNDVSLGGNAKVTGMAGVLMGSGALLDARKGTTLTGNLALASCRAFGQPLTQAKTDWSYVRVATGEAVLSFDKIQAQIDDGWLTGQMQLEFDPSRVDYSASATAHGVQIEPLVARAHGPLASGVQPIEARGLLDGQLHLSGTIGDASRRRGSGRFEIREGRMFRLPLIMALMQVLNLSFPDENAFDAANADFFVIGNRIQFREIALRNDALALVGSGTMTLPDRGLDLDLVMVNPQRWARVPVLAEFIEGTSRELMQIHVTGPLARPTVRPKPLRAISEELNRLFQKRKPSNAKTAAR